MNKIHPHVKTTGLSFVTLRKEAPPDARYCPYCGNELNRKIENTNIQEFVWDMFCMVADRFADSPLEIFLNKRDWIFSHRPLVGDEIEEIVFLTGFDNFVEDENDKSHDFYSEKIEVKKVSEE